MLAAVTDDQWTNAQPFVLSLVEPAPESAVQRSDRDPTKANRPLRASDGADPELVATPIAARSSGPLDPERLYPNVPPIFRQVETFTRDFREKRAKKHESSAAQARREYRNARDAYQGVDVDACDVAGFDLRYAIDPSGEIVHSRGLTPLEALRGAESTEKWHTGRAKGQRYRFRNLESCGSRVRATHCRMCGLDGKRVVPEGCGVARLCAKCSLRTAKKRRARFGRARALTIVESVKLGLCRESRKGGAFTEKMLTLTAPHYTIAEYEAHAEHLVSLDHPARAKWAREMRRVLRENDRDVVKVRVAILWEAWSRFARKLGRHWKQAHVTGVRHHRAAEWTPAHDGLGHPHFHVWLWSPFVASELVAEMWTEALEELGVARPMTNDRRAVIDLKRIYGFTNAMAAELLKGGRREALTLSRLQTSGGGVDVFTYSEGGMVAREDWDRAAAPVVASLYEVLEGKRLTQASAGFFEEEPPAACPFCASVGNLECRFSPNPDHPRHASRPGIASTQRGPPDEWPPKN